MSFTGKVVLITGASKGIGKATALKLGSQGASVVVNYFSDAASADAIVKEIGADRAIAVQADASKISGVEQLVEATVAKFGKIDVLFANAAALAMRDLESTTEADFDRLFNANVKGPYFLCQKAAPHMPPGSKVILVSTGICSFSSVLPPYLLYAATKGAIEQMTHVMSKDLARKGISVNAIAPGPTGTDLFYEGKSEAVLDGIKKFSPFNRFGTPEEQANAVAFLAGPEGSWVAGHILKALAKNRSMHGLTTDDTPEPSLKQLCSLILHATTLVKPPVILSPSVHATMSKDYKTEKEAFVSNLHGGTISEILVVTLVAPASVFLWSVLQARLNFFTPYTPLAGLVDFLLNGAAILFAVTLYSSNPIALNLALVLPAIGILLLVPSAKTTKQLKPPTAAQKRASWQTPALPIKPFVTTYRGCMLVITCVAILAVDFRVFPRRFGKVENWGTSLMDLGVGSFVFSAGLVGVRPTLKERFSGAGSSSFARKMATAMRSSLPLLILGLIRLWSVKGLDYAEHVSEYGVHWNFFFTLAFLPPFVALCDSVFHLIPSYTALSLLVGVAYEIVLESTDLTKFILTAPRTDLFSQNREGIFSFLGYLAIFLAGQATGSSILPGPGATALHAALAPSHPLTPFKHQEALKTIIRTAATHNDLPNPGADALLHSTSTPTLAAHARSALARTPSSATAKRTDPVLRSLLLAATLWSALFFALLDFRWGANLRVSRRVANLPYVVGVAAFNNAQLALFYGVERFVFAPRAAAAVGVEGEGGAEGLRASRLLRAFNRNGLAVFLVANLGTGAVNMAVPTLRVGAYGAMGVLLAYMGVLSGLVIGLDAWGVTVKL
ncbi:hypothetical protein FH972_025464 [Carpinus fangiana]|uniref:GPI-anchored wall transfer protein 1 n=1 Tax=Carpinus fangiana TaxID=176857 RepID=A0A5N6L1I2_9ROSI|nr:hypothetical protein FH972_025464 [Carpinus fangiana]